MDIIKIGIDRILSRSKVLLQKIREFAPFGIIYKNNEWINIETYDECLDSVKMRSFLMNTIIKDFQDNNCSDDGKNKKEDNKDRGFVFTLFSCCWFGHINIYLLWLYFSILRMFL